MSKYFKTSDGEEFYELNHAQNHARSLEDRTITEPTVTVVSDETEGAVDLSKMTKKELLAFAEANEIEVAPKATNAEIISAIELALSPVVGAEVLDIDPALVPEVEPVTPEV